MGWLPPPRMPPLPGSKRWWLLAAAAVACAVVIGIYASGRTASRAAGGQSLASAGEEQPRRMPATRAAPVRPAVRRRSLVFPMDPNAKWACDRQTVTADPVWRGDRYRLSFDFDIRNQGTADLRIRASGG